MFQRSSIRQAGFIRQRFNNLSTTFNFDQPSHSSSQLQESRFSPFKDTSPEPIDLIIQSYRLLHKNTARPSKCTPQSPRINKNQHKDYNDYIENTFDVKTRKRSHKREKTKFSQDCDEQIQTISIQPAKVEVSLAEAFQSKCHRMKQRLEYERNKFSKSKNKRTNRSLQEINQSASFLQLKPKISDPTGRVESTRRRNRSFCDNYNNENNKENNVNNANRIQQNHTQISECRKPRKTNTLETKKQKPASIETSSVKFFIPAPPTSRSKPITPREAYQHSLKKWKQLPEVVAKEKEREKQRNMQERLSKMKAHSMSVRNKILR